MRQNIAFFDKLGAGEITTRITADTNLVQDGISEKIGLTLTAIATFITAFVIGFVKYWRLTLILTSTIFTVCTIMGGGSMFIVKYVLQSIYTPQSPLLPMSLDTKLCIVVSAVSQVIKQASCALRARSFQLRINSHIKTTLILLKLIRYGKASIEAYAVGGSVAEESISSIRNAVAFSTQDKVGPSGIDAPLHSLNSRSSLGNMTFT